MVQFTDGDRGVRPSSWLSLMGSEWRPLKHERKYTIKPWTELISCLKGPVHITLTTWKLQYKFTWRNSDSYHVNVCLLKFIWMVCCHASFDLEHTILFTELSYLIHQALKVWWPSRYDRYEDSLSKLHVTASERWPHYVRLTAFKLVQVNQQDPLGLAILYKHQWGVIWDQTVLALERQQTLKEHDKHLYKKAS